MSTATLPPMNKLSMIGIWIETVIYGVNCVLYALCMFILLRGQRVAALRWVLVVTSTILFLLCTVHVGASLQQLLEGFVYVPADAPNYYWFNFSTTLYVLKNNVFNTTSFVQDFILIWRLYVVYMYDWRIILLPAVLEAVAIGSAYATSAIFVSDSNLSHLPLATSLVITGLSLGLTIDIFVMVAIVARLWWMGRKSASLTASTNRFASSIYVVVESGSISVVVTSTLLVLFATKSIVASPAVDVVAQLAAFTPFLIVVQAGLSSRSYAPSEGSSRTGRRWKIPFTTVVPREQDAYASLPCRSSRTPPSSYVDV